MANAGAPTIADDGAIALSVGAFDGVPPPLPLLPLPLDPDPPQPPNPRITNTENKQARLRTITQPF